MENNIILYSNNTNTVSINVTYINGEFWLTQKLIVLLFDCSTDNVSLHLKNIFNSGELIQNSVTEEFSVTASDGKTYKTKFYNLGTKSLSTPLYTKELKKIIPLTRQPSSDTLLPIIDIIKKTALKKNTYI